MDLSEKYMMRCIELARLGMGHVSLNPLVGCVIVHRNKIIGEGYHRQYGGPHAEVNAINEVTDHQLLKESTLYVSLEPCAHYGLTPPCSDLIVSKQIPRVIIGTSDPFTEVAGRGIEKLRNAGIEVETGILENECRELNKRFFTYHEKKRPYIILKWAQTADGYIDTERDEKDFGTPTWITGGNALVMVHKIRSEEDAILVGTNTAQRDNPSLTVRHWSGRNPVRAVIDKKLRLSRSLNLFDSQSETLIFNYEKDGKDALNIWVKVDSHVEMVPQILDAMYEKKILSVIVEGGKQLLDAIIKMNYWDEMHVFTGSKFFVHGIKAPHVSGKLTAEEWFDTDNLKIFRNH